MGAAPNQNAAPKPRPAGAARGGPAHLLVEPPAWNSGWLPRGPWAARACRLLVSLCAAGRAVETSALKPIRAPQVRAERAARQCGPRGPLGPAC